LLPYSVVGLSAVWFYHRAMNAMATGQEPAHFLGVHLERTKIILLIIAALLAASAVAASGIIGFIGLMVPHIVRMTLGANHRTLLPGSVLVGGILLLWSDILARNISSGEEMPIGIVTGVLGCLFFLYLLKQTQQRIF
jgi:iron complex transport system permease protein